MEIRQCLPYMEGDQPYSISPWVAIINFLQMTYRTCNIQLVEFSFCRHYQCQLLCAAYTSLRKINCLRP